MSPRLIILLLAASGGIRTQAGEPVSARKRMFQTVREGKAPTRQDRAVAAELSEQLRDAQRNDPNGPRDHELGALLENVMMRRSVSEPMRVFMSV